MEITLLILIFISLPSPGSPSWINLPSRYVALERDLAVSYEIEKFDPARFNDIHTLLHAGPALLYAARIPVGTGVIIIPCGVITYAGNHSLSIAYTNGTMIASGFFQVVWPVITLNTPTRVETYTTDVTLGVSFTRAVCSPKGRREEGVLQGGEFGTPTIWLKLMLCNDNNCSKNDVYYLVKLDSFYSRPSSVVTVPCRFWGWPGVYQVRIGAEIMIKDDDSRDNGLIATSLGIEVAWSLEYKILVDKTNLENCRQDETVVIELDYPHCIGLKDKIRLYREPVKPGLGRAQYVGEQRVVPGDKAVLFPCSLFNITQDFMFCFHYISTSENGKVSLVTDSCSRQSKGSWESWSSWSQCSVSCGAGSRSRFRFCSSQYQCKGDRVSSEPCNLAECFSQSTPTYREETTVGATRPIPSSPCSCGCTFILHSQDTEEKTVRDIHVVSGLCKQSLITWTLRVSLGKVLLLNLTSPSLSCPGLILNLRDGVKEENPLLYQSVMEGYPEKLFNSSLNTVRFELRAGGLVENLFECFAEFMVQVTITDKVVRTNTVFEESWYYLSQAINLLSPVVVVIVLVFLVLLCTLIMVSDYVVKKARYSRWKARPESGFNSPEHSCHTYLPQGLPYTSLSTISEYIPLSVENEDNNLELEGQEPVSPVKRRRRRLLRRRETLSDWCINKRSEIRKSSLPGKIKLYRTVSVKDSVDSPRPTISVSDMKPKEKRAAPRRERKQRYSSQSLASSCSSDTRSSRGVEMDRSGSEMTLRPSHSVSGFSCNSVEQEMEYDLYDCDIGNVMAAPGSMFAPAYWDCDTTPTLDLELTQLFPKDEDEVELREVGGRGHLATSITSDLTSSISSAVSRSTLVGEDDKLDLEEINETSTLLRANKELDTSCYYSGDESEPCLRTPTKKRNENLLNIQHVNEISFVDD